MPKFSPTHKRMLEVLSDGLFHTREELHNCLTYKDSTIETIRFHISTLRTLLNPIGEDIVCENRRGIFYRHVRLLHSPYRE